MEFERAHARGYGARQRTLAPQTADQRGRSALVSLGVAEGRSPFPWLALLLGALFFLIGVTAGFLLRGPRVTVHKR